MSKPSGITRSGVLAALALVGAVGAAVYALWRADAAWREGSGLGREFRYDLERLTRIDPDLVRYRQTGLISTGLAQARGLATSPVDDFAYVVGDRQLRVFRKDGQPLQVRAGEGRTFEVTIDSFNAPPVRTINLDDEPRALTIDPGGKIYLAFRDHVEVIEDRIRAGAERVKWPSLGLRAALTSIAATDKDVFVADFGNRVVVRYDTTGRIVNHIGVKNPIRNVPGFVVPSPYFDLAVAPDGLLRVADTGRHRIETYTFEGDFESAWGKFSPAIDGFLGCCNPVNFALLPGGRFVTAEKGVARVKVYSAAGEFESVVAGPKDFAVPTHLCDRAGEPDCASGGLDVAADADGRVLVLDPAARAVLIFTRTEQGDRGSNPDSSGLETSTKSRRIPMYIGIGMGSPPASAP